MDLVRLRYSTEVAACRKIVWHSLVQEIGFNGVTECSEETRGYGATSPRRPAPRIENCDAVTLIIMGFHQQRALHPQANPAATRLHFAANSVAHCDRPGIFPQDMPSGSSAGNGPWLTFSIKQVMKIGSHSPPVGCVPSMPVGAAYAMVSAGQESRATIATSFAGLVEQEAAQ